MNLDKYLVQTNDAEIKQWISKRVTKYLHNNPENQGEIEHVIDHLNSEYKPKKLYKMRYEDVRHNAEKWLKYLAKKGRGIIETNEDTEVVFNFKNGVKLVKLVGRAAYEREGALMSHCVASYYSKGATGSTEIYSLRDINNKPHCTIEVTKGQGNSQVQQIKGKGNGSIHPKYIKYILKILEHYFKMPVRESELENLGYICFDNDYRLLIEKICDVNDLQFIMFNGKKYYYKHQKFNVKAGAKL